MLVQVSRLQPLTTPLLVAFPHMYTQAMSQLEAVRTIKIRTGKIPFDACHTACIVLLNMLKCRLHVLSSVLVAESAQLP